MELVNKGVMGSKPDIGRIDLMPGYTLFDVRKGDGRRVIDALRNVDFFGTRLRPEFADAKGDSEGRKRSTFKGRDNGQQTQEKRQNKERSERRHNEAKETRGERDRKSYRRKDKKDSTYNEKPKYNGNYDIFIKRKK